MKSILLSKKGVISFISLLLSVLLLFDYFYIFKAGAATDPIPAMPSANADYLGSIYVSNATVAYENGKMETAEEATGIDLFENVPFEKGDSFVYRTNVMFTKEPDGDWQGVRIIFRGNDANDNICLIMWPNGLSIHRYLGGQYLNPKNTEIYTDDFTRELNHNYDVAIYSAADGKTTVTVDGEVKFSKENIGRWNALTGVYFQSIAATVEPTALYRTKSESAFEVLSKPDSNTDFAENPEFLSDGLTVNNNSVYSDTAISGYALINGIEIPQNDTYILKTRVLFSELPDAFPHGVRLIYRGTDNENYNCLNLGKEGASLYEVKYGSVVNYSKAHVSKRFVPETNKAYEVTIISSIDSVSVLIDGICYFADVPVADADVFISTRFVSSAASVEFVSAYSTVAFGGSDEFGVPEKPQNNYDYVNNMTLSGPLAKDNKYFASDELAHEEWNIIQSNISGEDSFVYKSKVKISAISDQGSVASLVFRGNSVNNFLSVSFYQTGVTLLKRSGWNDTVIDGGDLNTSYGYQIGEEFEVTIFSEPDFVSVWINGELMFKKIPVDKMEAIAGMGFRGFVSGTVTPVSLYRTIDENNFAIPSRPAGNIEYSTLANPVFPTDFTTSSYENGVLNATDSDKSGFINIGGLKLMEEYVFRANITVNAAVEHDYYSPRIIFRSNNTSDYYCFAMFEKSLLLLHMKNGIGVDDIKGVTYVPFNRTVGKTYDIAIYTTENTVSVWVDGFLYFNRNELPSVMNQNLTVISEYADFTVSDFSIYNTVSENFPQVPSKPIENYDFGTSMNIAVPDDFSKSSFVNGVFNNKDDDKAKTIGIGNTLLKDSYVFRTTLTVNKDVEHDYQSPRIIFKTKGDNDYLCFAFFEGSLLMLHMKDGIAVDDFGGNVAFNRVVDKNYKIDIYVTEKDVSLWIDGLIFFDKLKIPSEFSSKLMLVSEYCDYTMTDFSIYNTVSDDFKKIPENKGKDYGTDMLMSIPCLAYATYKEGILKNEKDDFGPVITFAGLDFDENESYVYNTKMTLTSETKEDHMNPNIIFRMNDSNNYLVLEMFRGTLLLLEKKNGQYCFDNFDGLNVPFAREVGRTYDVTILSEPESVSIWIDGLPILEDIKMPKGYASKMGVCFKGCIGTFSDISIYKTVSLSEGTKYEGILSPDCGEDTSKLNAAVGAVITSTILLFGYVLLNRNQLIVQRLSNREDEL